MVFYILYFVVLSTLSQSSNGLLLLSDCEDVDAAACQKLKAAQPHICHENTVFAQSTCPRTCGECSLECYTCPTPLLDPYDCTTTTPCGPSMSCVTKHFHSSVDNIDKYIMACESKEICKIYTGGFVGKRDSTTFECCDTHLCNAPGGTAQACTNDIVFLLDESGSQGAINFRLVIDFLKSLVIDLDIEHHRSRIAFVTFSTTPTVYWHLNDFTSQQRMLHAFDNVTFTGGATKTDEALRTIEHEVLVYSKGDRPSVPNFIVIITDGQSDDKVAAIREATDLRRNGTEIISIGIGSGLRQDVLDLMASDSNHVFTVNDFSSLSGIKSKVMDLLCRRT